MTGLAGRGPPVAEAAITEGRKYVDEVLCGALPKQGFDSSRTNSWSRARRKKSLILDTDLEPARFPSVAGLGPAN
jgi:hypothetical protein